MSVSATVTRSYQGSNSSVALSFTETVTSNVEQAFSQLVPNSANNQYVIVFTQANIQCYAIKAAAAMTLYTNNPSGSSPQDTIPLVAGQTLVWTRQTDGAAKISFSGNVTSFYITNASGTAAQFDWQAILTQ